MGQISVRKKKFDFKVNKWHLIIFLTIIWIQPPVSTLLRQFSHTGYIGLISMLLHMKTKEGNSIIM